MKSQHWDNFYSLRRDILGKGDRIKAICLLTKLSHRPAVRGLCWQRDGTQHQGGISMLVRWLSGCSLSQVLSAPAQCSLWGGTTSFTPIPTTPSPKLSRPEIILLECMHE